MMWNPDNDSSIIQPILHEMQDWEIAIKSHKKFMRLTPENRALFFVLLGKETDLDSYATSPVYYALTGRRGLWLYQDGNSYLPLCWHPNVDGQILVFPARGVHNPHILNRLLAEIPIPPAGIRLARIKKGEADHAWLNTIEGTTDRSIILVPIEELVLDWHYPVRILSTDVVSMMQGHNFMKIRNCVRQAERHAITVERLMDSHIDRLIDFTYRWANRRTNKLNEVVDLMNPYREILNMFNDESYNLDGLVFFIDGHIQAATLWEMPNNKSMTANSWVNLCNTAYRGLSEFMMKTLAKALHAQGIQYMNLGGSETKGLDDYKKKYIPSYSASLHSVEVVVEGNDLVLDSLIRIHEVRVAA